MVSASDTASMEIVPPHAAGRPTARRDETWAGVRAAFPALFAAIPLGLAFGVLVAQSPLDWWWAPVFAAVVFAGSLEFLLLGLIVTVAPLATIATTALVVNFRHVFYALSFPLHRVPGRAAKAYSTFALTDEAWALTAVPDAKTWSRWRILALQSSFHLAWVGSVAIGALGGTLIPATIVGLDFALTALFLVLTIDAARVRRSIPIPIVALLCALGAHLVAGEGMLVVAMAAFIAIVLAQYFLKKRRAHA